MTTDPTTTAAGGYFATVRSMSTDPELLAAVDRAEAAIAGPRPKPGAKPDEMALWQALEQGEWPRYAGLRLGVPRNRVEYLCEKWARQGIYDYGVVHDLGWISR